MANRRVTDLEPLATAPTAGVLHFVDVTNATQNAAGSSFKVTKADFLKESTAAILLNTAKVGYTDALVSANVSVVANTAKTGITSGQSSAIVLNTAKTGITTLQADAIIINTAKTGITSGQSSAIVINTAKVGYTEALVNNNTSVVANTAKIGITTIQANAIVTNTAKVGISVAQTNSIVANTTNLLALKVTVELDSTLTNFFYSPQAIKIASVTNINGSPTVSIKVNNVNYTFNALIAAGALVTLTSNAVGVVNLNGTYE